jgi:hypothetical protein
MPDRTLLQACCLLWPPRREACRCNKLLILTLESLELRLAVAFGSRDTCCWNPHRYEFVTYSHKLAGHPFVCRCFFAGYLAFGCRQLFIHLGTGDVLSHLSREAECK